MQLLLSNNAEVKTRDVNGKTVLHLAAACGHLNCLQLIMEYMETTDVLSKDKQDCTVLHWACYHGSSNNLKIVIKLILIIQDTSIVWSFYYPRIFSRSWRGILILLCIALGKFYCFAEWTNYNWFNSFSGSHACLEHLLTTFGNQIVHLKDEKQRTPLHIAALHGHVECAQLLLKHGADPQVADEEGRTPLIAAAQYGQSSVVGVFCQIFVITIQHF